MPDDFENPRHERATGVVELPEHMRWSPDQLRELWDELVLPPLVRRAWERTGITRSAA
jgi:hypothetical protein